MNFSIITEYCTKHEMSICTFEKLCGIGNGTVARWNPELKEPSKPSLDSLQKIVKVTGISMVELISEGES